MKLGPKIPLDPNNSEHYDKTKYKLTPGDVLTHSLMVLDNVKSDDWRIKFAALLHDVGKPETQERHDDRISNKGHDKAGEIIAEKICKRLKMSTEDTVFIVSLVKDHMKFKDIKNMKKSTLRRFINEPHYEALIDLSRADVLGTGYEGHDMSIIDFAIEMLEVYSGEGNEPAMPTPFINGYDLINIGMKPGPQFKELLDIFMDDQLEGKLTSRLEAITKLQLMGGIIRMNQAGSI